MPNCLLFLGCHNLWFALFVRKNSIPNCIHTCVRLGMFCFIYSKIG